MKRAFLAAIISGGLCAAQTPAPVKVEGGLIQGTGEEGLTVYRGIPFATPPVGDRAAEPFVEVNCAAIPEELIESEMFGHIKGSFTSAQEDKVGKFQKADGGTLFLDEVGDM